MGSEAEDLASLGNVDDSRHKVACAKEYERKAKDWDAKAMGMPEVCEICGSTKENDTGIKATGFAHSGGKVHQGFVMIRKWHKDLKEKEDKGELPVKGDPSADAKDDRDRRRERSRSPRADDKTVRKGADDKDDRASRRTGDDRDDRDGGRTSRRDDRDAGRGSRRNDDRDDRDAARGSRRNSDDRDDRGGRSSRRNGDAGDGYADRHAGNNDDRSRARRSGRS